MIAALKASAPSFKHDISTLPEVIAEEANADDNEAVTQISHANGKVEPSSSTGEVPLDREMLQALGNLWVETKQRQGRALAWDEFEENVMRNLHRLVPGFGTLKDVVGMVKALEEYSNPVSSDGGKRKGTVLDYRKVLGVTE